MKEEEPMSQNKNAAAAPPPPTSPIDQSPFPLPPLENATVAQTGQNKAVVDVGVEEDHPQSHHQKNDSHVLESKPEILDTRIPEKEESESRYDLIDSKGEVQLPIGSGLETGEEKSGKERLERHRGEVAGRVWIPEIWGQEDLLKDWIDCSAFDSSLVPKGIMSARVALAEEGRRANSARVRVENSCG